MKNALTSFLILIMFISLFLIADCSKPKNPLVRHNRNLCIGE